MLKDSILRTGYRGEGISTFERRCWTSAGYLYEGPTRSSVSEHDSWGGRVLTGLCTERRPARTASRSDSTVLYPFGGVLGDTWPCTARPRLEDLMVVIENTKNSSQDKRKISKNQPRVFRVFWNSRQSVAIALGRSHRRLQSVGRSFFGRWRDCIISSLSLPSLPTLIVALIPANSTTLCPLQTRRDTFEPAAVSTPDGQSASALARGRAAGKNIGPVGWD